MNDLKRQMFQYLLENYKNISECKNDAIYRLNNGELINNTLAILISSSLIIGSFITLFFYKILSKRFDYKTLDDSDENNDVKDDIVKDDIVKDDIVKDDDVKIGRAHV